ncbi:Crp/Fnr family transcriptional regulator [Prolixibacteraceae bacterium JC049]|nr:Crp/Fnr family transcriptional regulator [Prolixibacteraceae bacterium JC049]
MENMSMVLVQSPIFRGLNMEEINSLLEQVNYQIKKYSKDDLIAMRDDECNALLIVVEGSVKGEMLDLSGKVIKIEDIEAPRPLASAFIFGKQNRYPVDIIANGDVKILKIAKPEVLHMFQANEQVLKNYLNAISNRTQFLTRKLFFLSFKTIREKIAFYLSELHKQQKSEQLQLPLPQREIAELFGVARPSLARGFAELQDMGMIEVERKLVVIKDKRALLGLVNQ